ncbi:MAG: histidine kinase dimerization/phospho-acceptor domain-containing protein [Acutalibacter sp.]|jgi:signal transduction histidine kinase
MNPKSKRYSISTQFFVMLTSLGAMCVILFFLLNWGVDSVLSHYVLNSDFEERATERRIINFQEYVTDNHLTMSDKQAIAAWTRGKPLTLVEIYRDNVLVFSSYAPDSDAVADNTEEVPYYDWVPYYEVEFADGTADVLLYCDDVYRYFTYATIAEVIFCALVFLSCFLWSCQGIVRYIRQLKGQIQAMEAGDLSTPVPITGRNDLTSLAESLDAMRIALRTQQEQTAWTYAANQTLITEMSHDLRTPLTTLLLYTEILRYGKYQDQEQLASYLNKIDAKAQQIKQLSENILEYSLAARGSAVELENPALAKEVLIPYLEEAASHLGRCGFPCQTSFQLAEGKVAIHSPFLRRITDNLTSNITKYASSETPVVIRAGEEGGQVWVTFENAPDREAQKVESTCIGLSSVRTMMEKMHGSSTVEQTDTQFRVTLRFPNPEAPDPEPKP